MSPLVNMIEEQFNARIKLSVSLLLFSAYKMIVSVLVLSVPFQGIAADVFDVLSKFMERDCALPDHVWIFTRTRIWALLIYCHFAVALGSGLCNLYHGWHLVVRTTRTIFPTPLVVSEVDLNLMLGCISIVCSVFPLVFTQELFYVTVLACAQMGVELALFNQFTTMIRIIERTEIEHSYVTIIFL